MRTKKARRTRVKYPAQAKIDQDIADHLATLSPDEVASREEAEVQNALSVLEELAEDAAKRASKSKPTKAQVRAEAARIAAATGSTTNHLPPLLKPMTVERRNQAQFAASQLVMGGSVMLTDDSVRAMAELICYRMTRGGK